VITVKERDLEMGSEVRAAVELIKNAYGAVLTHDSGHTTAPTWIFTFPKQGNAQVAMRMNKTKLALYLRSRTLKGEELLPLVGGLLVAKKRYSEPDGRPAASVRSAQHAPFLAPSKSNPMLLIQPNEGCLKRVLDIYLGL
jgi:hypothetical protein